MLAEREKAMLTRCPDNQYEYQKLSASEMCDICRFVAQPFSECRCYSITSEKIPMIVYFCGGHYQECGIYQQHVNQAEPEADPGCLTNHFSISSASVAD